MRDYHASALGRHMGEKKMIAKLRQRFHWPRMAANVKKFCKECVTCQANKHST